MQNQKTTKQHTLKKDKFVNARGGNSHFLDLYCSKCNQYLVLYQKDGHGRLLRMYLDRIFEPQEFSLLQSMVGSKAGMPNLKCSKCGVIIGTPMIYEAEKRLAFRLIHGSFVKKKSEGVYSPVSKPKNSNGKTYEKDCKKLTFNEKILGFYNKITLPEVLASGIEIIHPYTTPKVREYVKKFYDKFFSDTKDRVFVFGINPGRFGSGVTGVSFTDPIALQEYCGIRNEFEKRRELSSQFVYEFIERWGGARKFYKTFFLTAVSPIGFIRNGVNHNYYADPAFFSSIKPFIIDSIRAQLDFGACRDAVIIFGTGKNRKIFSDINREYGFFKKIYALEHPRFIMQYRRKHLKKYLKKYEQVFAEAIS